MKKIVYILSVAVAAAACSKAEYPANTPAPQAPTTGKVEFSAIFGEAPVVKSEISGTSVLWKAGDEISILWNGGKTTAQADAAGEKANFEATVDQAAEYFAVYPSKASVSLTESTLAVGIPAEQNGAFEDANIAIARTSDRTLVFKNLCALGKITLSRNDIAKIEFKGKGNQSLAGDATLSLDNNGVPSVVSIASPEETIVLTPATGDAFEPGSYYFAAIPSTLEQGVSFTLTTVSGNTILGKASANATSLVRSEALNFGTLDATGSPTNITLTFNFLGTPIEGWPTTTQKASTLEEKDVVYPLDGTDYTFALRFPTTTSTNKYGVYWGGDGLDSKYGYRFIINGKFKYAGLPAIKGYKLIKVRFWQTRVGTSDNETDIPAVAIADEVLDKIDGNTKSSDMSLVSGGEAQAWQKGVTPKTLNGPYTYDLTGTVEGANYYAVIYSATGHKLGLVGIGQIEVTYEKVTE